MCDFFTRVAAHIGDELGIPVVINAPVMLKLMNEYGMGGFIDFETAQVCCG